MNDLKPCPFCGGKAIVEGHHNRFMEWYLCSCPECHVSQTGNEYGFKFEAIEAWNRRTENVAPVVYGRWIKGSSNPYCSECFVECRDETPFCPNCGVKMDGGDGDV
jgi:Lar family restriction alleviation protein